MREQILAQLTAHADPKFKVFNDKIVCCPDHPSLGVRVPVLRWICKSLCQADVRPILDEYFSFDLCKLYQEEHLLMGILIGEAELSAEDRMRYLDLWIPGILSWADCDCAITGHKYMKKDREFWYPYVTKWLTSKREFELRFSIVVLLQYFMTEEYLPRLFTVFSADYTDAYYVKMAQAWAITVCYVKYREKTLPLLQSRTLDPWIQNKAIQKCRDSLLVSAEDKAMLLRLKLPPKK